MIKRFMIWSIVMTILLIVAGAIEKKIEQSNEPEFVPVYVVYVVTEPQLEEIKRGGGSWVQVDSFQYGDDVESYKKVVHCRIVNGHVQCVIDEVKEDN